MPLDKIDTVATMFPQLNRRDIEWDLVRNGGSVQATTERVLRSGRLDHVRFTPLTVVGYVDYICISINGIVLADHTLTRRQPPPNFVAQESPTAASTLSGASVSNTPTQPKTQHTDLITRYNLFSRINSVVGEMHDFDGADNAVSSDKQSDTTAGIAAQSKAWSANKVERQALLKKRRDEMVLAARRKLLEKDQGGAPGERGPS